MEDGTEACLLHFEDLVGICLRRQRIDKWMVFEILFFIKHHNLDAGLHPVHHWHRYVKDYGVVKVRRVFLDCFQHFLSILSHINEVKVGDQLKAEGFEQESIVISEQAPASSRDLPL